MGSTGWLKEIEAKELMLTGLIIRPIMGKKTSILSKLEIAKKKTQDTHRALTNN